MARKTKGAAPKGADTTVAAGEFPGSYRLANNTRMKLALPVVDALVPASGSATFTVRSEAQLQALKVELDTLAELNGLGKDAFSVAPAEASE